MQGKSLECLHSAAVHWRLKWNKEAKFTKTYQRGFHFSLAQRYPKKNTPDAAMTWSVFIMKISAWTLLVKFHNYLQSRFQKMRTYFTHAELYDVMAQDKIRSVFPNLDIALRIFLTFMLINVSAERSCSQLKRVKNSYRTTMTQERLDALSTLHWIRHAYSSVDFDGVIKDFAFSKSRKKTFCFWTVLNSECLLTCLVVQFYVFFLVNSEWVVL